jgi:MFS family permease
MGEPPHRPWYAGATRNQWLALLAALLGWAFDGFEMGIFPQVSQPALIELLGLQDEHAKTKDDSLSDAQKAAARQTVQEPVRAYNGLLSAAFLIGAALGGFFFGWLGDRVGRVRAMVLSVLTYAVFTGLCGFVAAPWHLAVLRFIASLGMGGEWALGVALVMETWSSHARPVLAGLIGAASNVGFLLAALPGKVLSTEQSWRVILILCAFPALLTFLLRMFVPESEKWVKAVSVGPKPGLGEIFTKGLRFRAFLGAGLGAVALLATWGGVQWIPLWVGSTPNSDALKGDVQIWSALGAIVGSFLGSALAARFPRRVAYFVLCAASLAVCEYLFVGLRDTDFGDRYAVVWFLATVFLVGAFSASFYGWLPLYLPELFPTRVRATGQGFCFNSGRVIAAAGVLLVTFGVDLKGNYAQASALVCSVYVIGLLLAWLLPETRGQPLPE